MLLAVDIGNTHTVLGVFRSTQLVAERRIESSPDLSVDAVWLAIQEMYKSAGLALTETKGVGISSVVPRLTGLFKSVARERFRVEPVTISASLDIGIKIHYKNPMQVGTDRLCNAIAGFNKYGGPLIIIDFGTATTFDVVSKDGDYLGGAIALGLESSAAELHRRTALLPNIELQFPKSVMGQDTVSSMQAGVMMGAVDAVEGLVRRIQAEIGQNARVIATGGLSSVISKHTNIIEACEPSLVLEGVRLICERVTKR